MTGPQQTPLQAPEGPPEPPTSMWKRIAALAGVVFMVFLTILFTYSIATGSIFAW